jgi:hypothetical protein
VTPGFICVVVAVGWYLLAALVLRLIRWKVWLNLEDEDYAIVWALSPCVLFVPFAVVGYWCFVVLSLGLFRLREEY